MKPVRPLRIFLIALFALLASCAQLGLAPADKFDEKLAYAYGVSTAVKQTATAGLAAKSLSVDDAKHVLVITDQAKALLDAARVTGDPLEAQNKLLLATQILTQLQAYLNSKGVK